MSQATLSYRSEADSTALYSALSLVRRRFLTVGLVCAVCWVGVAFSSAILTGMWLDLLWELSPSARIATWVLASVCGAMVFAIHLVRLIRRSYAPAIAHRIDSALGTGGEVRAGLALDRPKRNWSELTSGMARIAVQRAGHVASTVLLGSAVSTRPLRRAAIALCVFPVIVILLFIFFPRLAHTQWSRFTRPHDDVPPFSSIQFNVAPGDVAIRYGSSLEITATTTGAPVDRLELVTNQSGREEALPMFSGSSGQWRASVSRVLESGEYYVRAQRGRSARYKIDVITVPLIEQVRVRITPPAYTNRPSYEGSIPKEGIAGLPGAQVLLTVRSNRPLSGGTIRLIGEDDSIPVEMTPGAERNEAVGRFSVQSNGRFELTVRDIAGTESSDRATGAISLLHDDRPLVRMIKPQSMSMATPNVSLPVEISAEDDYGLSKLVLFRSLNDSRFLAQDVVLPAAPPVRYGAKVALPLFDYGLSPGDTIKLFARVEDNDPAGAKGSESQVITVQIISQEEFEKMVRIRRGLEVLLGKYRAAERMLEKLQAKTDALKKQQPGNEANGNEQNETAKGQAPIDPGLQQELRQLQREMEKDAELLRSAANNLLPYDLDRELTQQLDKLAVRLEIEAEQLAELLKREDLSADELAKSLGGLAERLGLDRKEFQNATAGPREELERIFPLMSAGSRFMVLVEQQSELADRMNNLKGQEGKDDPALKNRLRELQEQQAALSQELKDVLKDIETAVAKLPEEAAYDAVRSSALSFVEKVRESGASGMMQEAESALAEFAGTKAAEKAKEAADTLRKLLSDCNGMCEGAGNCLGLKFSPGMSKSMSNTISQLLGEMGFGTGSGVGEGSGNGFSTRRGLTKGIGLYGEMRGGLESQSGSGSGSGPEGGTSGSGVVHTNRDPTLEESAAITTAGGAGDPSIPLSYRKRVGQYFQRLAEELEKND